MMISFDSLICTITGRKFRYHAILKYTPDNKNGQINVTKSVNFSCDNRNANTMYRDVKKLFGENMVSQIPKRMLNNGKLEIEHISYLGFY